MGLSEENVGNLESLAAKRKARLLEIKKKKLKIGTDCDNIGKDSETNEELPDSQVLFRNYQPSGKKLEDSVLPQVEPAKVEELIEEQLKYSETKEHSLEVAVSNLAPQKLTFDLQRGIQDKLDRLERKTDKAIAELIRERLKEGRQLDFIIGKRMQEKEAYMSDDE